MQQRYLLLLLVACFACGLGAQSVTVPANADGTEDFPFTYLDLFIDADTTDAGVQQNDTYLLEAGGIYFFTKTNRWDFDVTLAATGDTETLGRPVVDRINPAGGTSLDAIYRGSGNFHWEGIYIVLGDEGANAASYETASFRPEGIRKTYSWNDCVIEKSRQGTIRSEGDSISVFITNSILRNFGDYELLQGNGRVVDLRTGFGDSVVISGNVIHNILDRIYIGFRQRGLNYFEFTQNTVFNHVGRHGFIQLKNTKTSVINDNLIQNPSIIGTKPTLANEQIELVDVENVLFSLDTMVEDASIEMLNNNIYYTDDVLTHYENVDTITKPNFFSPTFLAALTNDITEAYFSEVLELNAVPDRTPLIQYASEAIRFPDSVGITNIMVEDSLFAVGTDYDQGYLFDFDRFDPCYDPTSTSAMAATDGGAVGARGFCPQLNTSIVDPVYNANLRLRALPNPASERVSFTFQTTTSGDVRLEIFDVRGVRLRTLVDENLPAGEHNATLGDLGALPRSVYIAHILTPEGRMFVKFMKQ